MCMILVSIADQETANLPALCGLRVRCYGYGVSKRITTMYK